MSFIIRNERGSLMGVMFASVAVVGIGVASYSQIQKTKVYTNLISRESSIVLALDGALSRVGHAVSSGMILCSKDFIAPKHTSNCILSPKINKEEYGFESAQIDGTLLKLAMNTCVSLDTSTLSSSCAELKIMAEINIAGLETIISSNAVRGDLRGGDNDKDGIFIKVYPVIPEKQELSKITKTALIRRPRAYVRIESEKPLGGCRIGCSAPLAIGSSLPCVAAASSLSPTIDLKTTIYNDGPGPIYGLVVNKTFIPADMFASQAPQTTSEINKRTDVLLPGESYTFEDSMVCLSRVVTVSRNVSTTDPSQVGTFASTSMNSGSYNSGNIEYSLAQSDPNSLLRPARGIAQVPASEIVITNTTVSLSPVDPPPPPSDPFTSFSGGGGDGDGGGDGGGGG